MVVVLVLSAVNLKRRLAHRFAITLSIVALYFNGAQTEFILLIFALIFMALIYSLLSIRVLLSLMGGVTFGAFIVLNTVHLLPTSRMFQILDLGNSSSGQHRMALSRFGVEQVKRFPVFGEYGGYVELGDIGFYSHNILSAWVNLGALGIALYILMFFLLWKEAISSLKEHRNCPLFRVFLMFLIFVSSALLFSKSYNYVLIGLLLGFYYKWRRKNSPIT